VARAGLGEGEGSVLVASELQAASAPAITTARALGTLRNADRMLPPRTESLR
jgi:hypothetical protein